MTGMHNTAPPGEVLRQWLPEDVFVKKTQTTPRAAIETATKRLEAFT